MDQHRHDISDEQEQEQEQAVLRSTNVSRPQFTRPLSKRSIAATTEEASAFNTTGYRSVSTRTDDDSPTLPMDSFSNERAPHALQSNSEPHADAFLPSTKHFLDRLADGARDGEGAHVLDVNTIGEALGTPTNSPPRRKPLSRPTSSRYSGGRYSQLDPDVRPPTPGADDNAVRFALDQLTRDEEVRGSRQYPTGSRYSEQMPEQRGLLDGADHDRSRGINSTAYVEPPYTYVPPVATVAPIEKPTFAPMSPVMPQAPQPITTTTTTTVARTAPIREPVVPVRAQQPLRTAPPPTTALPQAPELFQAYETNEPLLKYLPTILKPLFLGLYILLCLLMLAALAFSGAWSSTHVGLLGYVNFGGTRWFIFKYLPTIVCMIMLVWLFQIQNAVQRIAPFIAMTSHSAKSRRQAPLMEWQPTNYLLPHLFYFSAGQPIIGFFMLIAWLHIFTPPLFAALYNVYFYGPIGLGGPGSWRWDAVQGVAWALAGLYLLLLIALILLAVWIWRQYTGVKWDPRSLASVVAVLDRSNVVRHYENTETFRKPRDFKERLGNRSDWLGFWTTSRSSNDFSFYALGEEDGEVPRGFHDSSRNGAEKRSMSLDVNRNRNHYSSDYPNAAEGPVVTNLEHSDDLYSVRHRYLPWYLRLPFLLLFCIITILLYVAYMVISYINRNVLHGFYPGHFKIAPNNDAFSATNFFYAIVPAAIAQLIFLCWLSVDYAYRRLQPYVAMSKKDNNGAPATRSMLSDYPARLPFSTTIYALAHGDLVVAWFSFLSLLAASFPILAGGIFMSQFYIPDQQTRVSVEPVAYYILNAITFLFVFFGLPLALITSRRRRLPHAVTTLAENFSWLYASRILGEREWRHQGSNKVEMTTRLMAPITEHERQFDGGRYAYGRFIGRDGRPHLGIERVGRVADRTRMTERTFRPSSIAPTGATSLNSTPYTEVKSEKVSEEVPIHNREPRLPVVERIPPMPVMPAVHQQQQQRTQPAPIKTIVPPPPRVEAGMSPIQARNPTIASSHTYEGAGTAIYDPHARPAISSPTGFPVGRELAPEPLLVRQVQQMVESSPVAIHDTRAIHDGQLPTVGAQAGVPGLREMPRPMGPGVWAGEVRNPGSQGAVQTLNMGSQNPRRASGGRNRGAGNTYI